MRKAQGIAVFFVLISVQVLARIGAPYLSARVPNGIAPQGETAGTWIFRQHQPWAYHLGADPSESGVTDATAAYITVESTNRNPKASDANIYVWLGTGFAGSTDADGFIQVGYAVLPNNRFSVFAYTTAPIASVTCSGGTEHAFAGHGCMAPLPFAGHVKTDGSYWFQAEAQERRVALAVAGSVIMRVAYRPRATHLLKFGYPVAEISALGNYSPQQLIHMGGDAWELRLPGLPRSWRR
ncbi:MAG: hypothetical protein ACR2PL_23820 [Dehalococcoidia bacterium]